MQTTLEELEQLFQLKDHRQIKKGLLNKIRMVNDEDVLVKDEELKTFINDFRTGGSYDMDEVCQLYKISKNRLLQLVKNKVISSFQLVTAQGSKILFLKSELDKENNILLAHSKKTDVDKLARLAERFLTELADEHQIGKEEIEVFKEYYFSYLTLDEIGKERGMSAIKARRIIFRLNYKLINHFREYVKNFRKIYEYERLKEKYNKLKNFIEGLEFIKKEFNTPAVSEPEVYSKKVRDLDFSVRALNCLKVAGIETVRDLTRTSKPDLLKFRNIGKKSLIEIESMMQTLGVSFEPQPPQSKNAEGQMNND